MKKSKELLLAESFKYAPVLDEIIEIDPKIIKITPLARLKCQNCGLYGRTPFCPPNEPSIKECRNIIYGYDTALVFIWKNDGTRMWSEIPEELSHLDFSMPKKNLKLKGAEAGMARYITVKMKWIKNKFIKRGYEDIIATIQGHCDLCGRKCPMRETGKKCKKGGLPSGEALGIDVYDLNEKIKVDYEYPLFNFITSTTLLLLNRK